MHLKHILNLLAERIRDFWFVKRAKNLDSEGQSLVETALVLPILILLMVGVIEIGQLVVTQNRISTAARNAARFAANGGEDAGIRDVTLNTVTQTLDLSSGVWDIWSVRGAVDAAGNIPTANFMFTHIYGDGRTTEFTATNTISFSTQLRQQIEADLRQDENNNTQQTLGAGLNVVGVYILHDVESILGLSVIPDIIGFNTISGFSYYRRSSLSVVRQTAGCRGVFPIAVEQNVRTITQVEYDALTFTFPATKPPWITFAQQPQGGTTVPLLQGREGYIFKFDEGINQRAFNWLKWNTNITGINGSPDSILAASLRWPGNISDFQNFGDPPSPVPGGWPHPFTFRGFAEVGDPTDQDIQLDDWVARDTISGGFGGSQVTAVLQSHITNQRTLRLVLWDFNTGGYDPSPVPKFRVEGYGIFRIRGFGSGWILAELIRIDSSCGQPGN